MKKSIVSLFVLMLFVNSVYGVITGIVGSPTVCTGGTRTLTNATPGGTWSSSNTAKATVSSTGVVTGIASGTTLISYIAPGGYATLAVTVNVTPPAITGSTEVCGLETTTLSNSMPGGMWSSSRPAAGSVSTSGVVRANTPVPDTVTIFYTMPGSGCRTSSLVTINDHPFLLWFGSLCAPSTVLCIGAASGFAVATSTGSLAGMMWSSSNPSVATASIDGSVLAVAPGTAVISLTTAEGCSVSAAVVVPTPPPAITGTMSTCAGRTTTLTNTMVGGAWYSNAPSVATVSTSGVVTGAAAGTARISYIVSGCSTTQIVTVNAVPAAITGTLTACPGTTTTLSNTLAGGTWTSSNTGISTVGVSNGIVTGVAAGTSVISYITSAGCSKSAIVTVNTNPNITGTKSMCPGKTTMLASAPTASTWASSNTASATISAGIVTGIATGTAVITATAATGCKGTAIVTVNAIPPAMTGVQSVCVGSTTTLSNAVTGGTWASSSAAIASVVGSTGVVTGVIASNATISYTSPAGCLRTAVVTVNAVPTITGTAKVCVGTTATLMGAATGGTWSTSASAIATVGTSGIVTGVTSGTTTIDYTLANGCKKTAIATVNVTPTAITGTASLCGGTVTTLSNSLPGGTWASSNVAVASVGTAGNVTGAAIAGTSLISYTYGTCRATRAVTVLAIPAAISGVAKACPGTTTSLTNTTAGGAWSTAGAGIATVASGLVTGVAAGTTNIIYTLPNTCSKSVIVTVNANPAAITGTRTVCAGSTTALANATTGLLSWSSSDLSKASVTAAGLVTGVAAGTSRITYKITSGCYSTALVTVNALPAAITGTLTACPGTTTTLSNTMAGGTWSSSNTAKATVGTSTGIVTGVAAGTAQIIYTTSAGCTKSVIVTVNAVPSVTGTKAVCVGKTTQLTCTPAATSWVSSNTATATAVAGIVTGVAGGVADISVTATTGCKAIANVTVNALPATISGTLATCVASTTGLSNTMTGGTWVSSMPGVATIGSTGVVTGIAQGFSTISYTSAAGCLRTGAFTVNALPTITGTPAMCVGTAATLSGLAAGGTWSSSATTKATVGTTGVVMGVSAGTATISYTLANGCRRTVTATVNTTPAAIGGAASLCSGSTTTLTNTLPGGIWTSSSAAIAAVGTAGNVTGATAGTALISYTYGTCRATHTVSVLASPTIMGTPTVCVGTAATLSGLAAGGTWSSSATTTATVGTTGIVTGVSAGTAALSYTLANGCRKTVTATVNTTPAAIGGTASLCSGSTTTLTNTLTGGVWTSSSAAIAAVGTAGNVTGAVAGTALISYTFGTCRATRTVSVLAVPAAIGGIAKACPGTTATLTNTTTGGVWSTANTGIGTVNTAGLLTGVAAGTVNIVYMLPNTCSKSVIATINANPAAIGGTATVCKNATTSLSNTGTGTWSSLNLTITSVSAAGVVTGVNAGTGTIVFTGTNGCKATKIVTVTICSPREMTTEVATTELNALINIFPNPTQGMFTIDAPEEGTLSIFAVDGKEVSAYNVARGNTNIVLPQELPAGMYICRFSGKEGANVVVRLMYRP